ncbi:tRNA (adenosine(37)-N6)-threonylcarbamoyltransferase complex dimerization subunit type 1 TsaB [Candidatus Woesebacteria bacterium]|nr:tRNA (adenosine(37)-N6)-threonylcarbamoyltransferase complex dimerization subunit type 1 TsaB [Candidatus Woesebacteria bacterium]QQG47931.1 MAG: tRNA (adenosine(37)-N6)-threonylcarbamoyltransferase complex dimerization subunit type 1 TsaB [Candidatus Woesebacteria bacterium]
MKLYIDTSNSQNIKIILDEEVFETQSHKNSSQFLLSFIDESLKKKKKKIRDIKSIEVNVGPGSFTGLRVGVSVANILGYELNIPVNGVDIKTKKYLNIKYE